MAAEASSTKQNIPSDDEYAEFLIESHLDDSTKNSLLVKRSEAMIKADDPVVPTAYYLPGTGVDGNFIGHVEWLAPHEAFNGNDLGMLRVVYPHGVAYTSAIVYVKPLDDKPEHSYFFTASGKVYVCITNLPRGTVPKHTYKPWSLDEDPQVSTDRENDLYRYVMTQLRDNLQKQWDSGQFPLHEIDPEMEKTSFLHTGMHDDPHAEISADVFPQAMFHCNRMNGTPQLMFEDKKLGEFKLQAFPILRAFKPTDGKYSGKYVFFTFRESIIVLNSKPKTMSCRNPAKGYGKELDWDGYGKDIAFDTVETYSAFMRGTDPREIRYDTTKAMKEFVKENS
jgi:hypothetical protein